MEIALLLKMLGTAVKEQEVCRLSYCCLLYLQLRQADENYLQTSRAWSTLCAEFWLES